MKKALCFILALILILCGCAVDEERTHDSGEPEPKPSEAITETAQTYTAADKIAFSTSNLESAAQIGNTIYILQSGIIRSINLTDESAATFFDEKSIDAITAYGGDIYGINYSDGIYAIGADGALKETYPIDEGLFENVTPYVTSFFVTEDYFVIARGSDHTFISKSDMSITTDKVTSSNMVCPYTENKYFVIDTGDIQQTVYVYDIDKNEAEKLGSTYGFNPIDVVYDKYSDRILGLGNSRYGISVLELNLDTMEASTLKSYAQASSSTVNTAETSGDDLIGSYSPKIECITMSDNLCCLVSNKADEICVYKTETKAQTLNIALIGMPGDEIEYLNVLLDELYGIQVGVKTYGYGTSDMLNLKILARDKDIDIVFAPSNIAYYVVNGYYVDLNQFDVLKDNIEKCANMLESAFSYEGKIFAVPLPGQVAFDCFGDSANNTDAYLAKYVDLPEKSYGDENGDALYEYLLNYYETRTDDPIENMIKDDVEIKSLCEGVTVTTRQCYMINPASEKQEEAAIFLNEVINLATGKTYDEIKYQSATSAKSHFYDLEYDYSNCYPSWRYYSVDIFSSLNDAKLEAEDDNKTLSESDVRRIADEYSALIRQMIME